MSQITSRVQNVTPEDAKRWLGVNSHNRHLSDRRIDILAAAIKRGEWELNGEAIKFDEDGKLLDGQHRLHAIIKADKGVQMVIVRGLAPIAQETMDTGKKRSIADVLTLRGIPTAHMLGSALRSYWRYKQDGEFHSGGIRYAPTNQELIALWEKNPGLLESVKTIGRLSQRSPLKTPTGARAIHYVVAEKHGVEVADDFFEKLYDFGYGGPKTDPVIALRKRLLDSEGVRDTMHSRVKLALMVKAINAYLNGEEVNQLRWRVGGPKPEPFPKLLRKNQVS